MNLTTRVAATAALLMSLSAGVSAAILVDASSGSDDSSLTAESSALTMSAFDSRVGRSMNVTSGAMLASAAPDASASSLNLLAPAPATVTLPAGLTLIQPKPRASTPLPYYMQGASYRQQR